MCFNLHITGRRCISFVFKLKIHEVSCQKAKEWFLNRKSVNLPGDERYWLVPEECKSNMYVNIQGGIRVNLTPKMRQSLLNVTPRSHMMPNFTFPLHRYDSKKSLNRQQVLLQLAPTLVKVNDLTPLRQEFSNSTPKIFGVVYTDSTLG